MSRRPGEVHVWYMTESERLAYIKKHPIIPYEERGSSFADIHDMKKTQGKSKKRELCKSKCKGIPLTIRTLLIIP
jgi:hypothetical protein